MKIELGIGDTALLIKQLGITLEIRCEQCHGTDYISIHWEGNTYVPWDQRLADWNNLYILPCNNIGDELVFGTARWIPFPDGFQLKEITPK